MIRLISKSEKRSCYFLYFVGATLSSHSIDIKFHQASSLNMYQA